MSSSRSQRTAGHWWLCVFSAALAVWQAAAAARAFDQPPVTISLPWGAAAAAGAAWALIFALLTVNLWRLRPRAARRFAWALIAFTGYSAARLALFARAEYDLQRLPFVVLAALLVSALPALYLLRRPSSKGVNGDA